MWWKFMGSWGLSYIGPNPTCEDSPVICDQVTSYKTTLPKSHYIVRSGLELLGSAILLPRAFLHLSGGACPRVQQLLLLVLRCGGLF